MFRSMFHQCLISVSKDLCRDLGQVGTPAITCRLIGSANVFHQLLDVIEIILSFGR